MTISLPPAESASIAQGGEQSLWRAWLDGRLPEQRSALFFHYSEWTRTIAAVNFYRYPHAMAEWRDYVQLASLGLLKAIDRFDPSIQASFKAYAEPYMKGAILKGLSCFAKDGRHRPDIGVMEMLPERHDDSDFYSLEEIVDAAVGLAFGHFLELGISEEAPVDNDPLSIYEGDRQFGSLLGYVERLPERERRVVEAHYFQHLSFTEVAELLGVSKPRITQLHKKALDRIREWYEQDGGAADCLL